MTGPRDLDATTTIHRYPDEETRSAEGREGLVMVSPRSTWLALPALNQPAGRAWVAEAGLKDPTISRHLLLFQRERGRLTVRGLHEDDQKAPYLDGQPMPKTPTALREGAVLRLGSAVLVYRSALLGPPQPAGPLGGLIGPWGLRTIERALRHLKERSPRVVLLTGETGAGKDVLAEHLTSAVWQRTTCSVIDLNTIPKGLAESELFGHQPGAYPDAKSAYPGRLRLARGGVVLLNEIGDLELGLQGKLLHFLETGEVYPLHGTKAEIPDVRVVCATWRPLDRMVAEGTFRHDLLARIRAHHLHLPALRERPDDVLAIVEHLASRMGIRLETSATDPRAVERLLLAPWSLNVRDAIALLEGLSERQQDRLGLKHVEQILGSLANVPREAPPAAPLAAAPAAPAPPPLSAQTPLSWGPRKKTPAEWIALKKQVDQLRAQGQSPKDIAARFGVASSAIHQLDGNVEKALAKARKGT